MGGDWPGPPDATTQFPQDMLVDYVRVYQTASTAGPCINTGGIVDAATYGPALAPGSLASIFGTGLATDTNGATFDFTAGAFSESASGVQVFVNGAASPLIYLSPQQINFAVPWDSLVGTPLNVEVMLERRAEQRGSRHAGEHRSLAIRIRVRSAGSLTTAST